MDVGKIREIILWPELRIAWLVAAFLVALLASSYISSPRGVFFVQAGLIVVLGILVFFGAYRAAKIERGTKIEKNELKSVFLNLEDALVVYDNNFQILLFNPAAEKLFHLERGSVSGRRLEPKGVEDPSFKLLAQVIFPSLAPSVINRSTPGQYPQVVDLSFSDPILELRVSTSIVADSSGAQIGFMKIIKNRTREESLMKSKTEFLTIASHQLRTPITELNWAIESLAGDQSFGDTNKTIVESALVSARQLKRIVEDLLDIARVEEGRFGYAFEEADIIDFVSAPLAQVAALARKSGIKVYFDRPKSPLPKILIDPKKLSIALVNILENAVRYNVENGEVVVKVEQRSDGPYVEIAVSDTGLGIPKEDIEKLFTKFFRAENVLKSQTEGSGLGLYIAKNIIQAHGGRVWAESELGRGSAFHFTLPTDPNLVPKHEVAME